MKPLIVNLVKHIFQLLLFVASFYPKGDNKRNIPVFLVWNKRGFERCQKGKYSNSPPFLRKRQLSQDMRFLWD